MKGMCCLFLSLLLIQGCAVQPPAENNTDIEVESAVDEKRCSPDQALAAELEACYVNLKDSELGNVVAGDREAKLKAIADELDIAKKKIKTLQSKNVELSEEVKKKDEALRRLREVTLGS